MVIEMDNFDLIIKNTFMRTSRVRVFPQLRGMMVMNKAGPCFVCGQGRPYRVEDRIVVGEQLTIMQLARRCTRGDLTFLTVMVVIESYHVLEVLDSMLELLDELADVMLANLPDGLPPKRSVEHRI